LGIYERATIFTTGTKALQKPKAIRYRIGAIREDTNFKKFYKVDFKNNPAFYDLL
jgi:hypothetical protein